MSKDDSHIDAPELGENLPALVEMPALDPITVEHAVKEVMKDDLTRLNEVLDIVRASWGQVTSIGQVKTLAELTFTAIEKRRDILGLPYGAQRQTAKGGIIFPLD